MKTIRYEILNYLRTGLLNIQTGYGYNNSIKDVIPYLKNLNDSVSLPYIAYKMMNETREPINNDKTLFMCTAEILIAAFKDADLDIASSGYDITISEGLIEDLLAYFENGDWITAGKSSALVGKNFAVNGVFYGVVKTVEVSQILEPVFAESKIETAIRLKVTYTQKLS